jgi:hypothetical protein
VCTYTPMTTSASAPPGRMPAQSRAESRVRGKRLRVEVLLAGTTVPEPLPVHDLVEADLWSQLPVDLEALLALLPHADLYLQDEMRVAFHPTLTRVWCRKGRRGQRLVEAPGDNRHPSMALAWSTGVMVGLMAGSHIRCVLRASACCRGTFKGAGTSCSCDYRQSQDPHLGWLTARASPAHRVPGPGISGVYACL